MPSGACAAFVRAHAKPPQLRLQEKPRTSLRSGRKLPLLPGPMQAPLSLKWDLFAAFAPSGLGGGPRPGTRMALMAFKRRAGAGRTPASTGLIEVGIKIGFEPRSPVICDVRAFRRCRAASTVTHEQLTALRKRPLEPQS